MLVVATAAAAQPAMRAEVAAQRAAIEHQYQQDKVVCEQRFAVAACLDALRQHRREALAPLVRRENEWAAEERRERAADQARRVREREQAAAAELGGQRERATEAAAPVPPTSHPVRARNAEQVDGARQQADQAAKAEAARRRSQAAERTLRQQQRLADHEASERQRVKPAASPLPMPAVLPASAVSTPR